MTESRYIRRGQRVRALRAAGGDRLPAGPGVGRADDAAPGSHERTRGVRPVRLQAATSPIAARIVVTDHDSDLLWLLQELLREEGYEVLVPPELDDPYPFIKAQRPAAVVLDAPLRRETAIQGLLDTLRVDPHTAATPVVLCSTSPAALDGLAGREADGLYLLAKPFDLDRLLAVLVTALCAPPPAKSGRAEAATSGDVEWRIPRPVARTTAVPAGGAARPA